MGTKLVGVGAATAAAIATAGITSIAAGGTATVRVQPVVVGARRRLRRRCSRCRHRWHPRCLPCRRHRNNQQRRCQPLIR